MWGDLDLVPDKVASKMKKTRGKSKAKGKTKKKKVYEDRTLDGYRFQYLFCIFKQEHHFKWLNR
jgi:hypothetical protein